MPRLKPRTLRGSIMQNNTGRARDAKRGLMFKIRLFFILGIIGLLLISLLWVWFNATGQISGLKKSGLRLTQRAHYAVKDIVVEGRQYTDKDDIFKALQITAKAPILAFDPQEAHDRIRELPWIADVVIQRRLPDTLVVRLTERQPIARWQNNNATVVIDSEGKILKDAKPEQFANLLLVTGENAPEQTGNLLTTLNDFPDIMSRVKGAVRVGERRWNIYLQSGQLVRLPEQKMAEALRRLNNLINDRKILDRNVTGIDLRLPDRLILEPGEATEKETKTK